MNNDILNDLKKLSNAMSERIHKRVLERYTEAGMCEDFPHIYQDALSKEYMWYELRDIINKYDRNNYAQQDESQDKEV